MTTMLLERTIMGIPSPRTVSTGLQRIAELANESPEMAFTSLNHHINLELMLPAYHVTRKDGAVGVDGQTAAAFAEDLEENLEGLVTALRSGRYRAPPVRRVYIPKAGSPRDRRPIGIPTFADKVLQRAVCMVLEAIYEQDFLDCSYGFRPGRSAHGGLQVLWNGLMGMGGGWVVELDIKSFFDNLSLVHLREFVRHRVRDGVLLRAINKWLKAGICEAGRVHRPGVGTPQGGVISPLLANLYLHHVLDQWFADVVQPRMHGRSMMVRFADDGVLVFSNEADARRVMKALPQRFGRFGLELHPEKTRVLEFRPRLRGSFEFLGFTHTWSTSRRGKPFVKRTTASSRFRRSLKAVGSWCKRHRHLKVRDQHEALTLKLQGHYAYYGITGNADALVRFHHEVKRIWRKWLHRRSHKAAMTWERFNRLALQYQLPRPRVVHSVYSSA